MHTIFSPLRINMYFLIVLQRREEPIRGSGGGGGARSQEDTGGMEAGLPRESRSMGFNHLGAILRTFDYLTDRYTDTVAVSECPP